MAAESRVVDLESVDGRTLLDASKDFGFAFPFTDATAPGRALGPRPDTDEERRDDAPAGPAVLWYALEAAGRGCVAADGSPPTAHAFLESLQRLDLDTVDADTHPGVTDARTLRGAATYATSSPLLGSDTLLHVLVIEYDAAKLVDGGGAGRDAAVGVVAAPRLRMAAIVAFHAGQGRALLVDLAPAPPRAVGWVDVDQLCGALSTAAGGDRVCLQVRYKPPLRWADEAELADFEMSPVLDRVAHPEADPEPEPEPVPDVPDVVPVSAFEKAPERNAKMGTLRPGGALLDPSIAEYDRGAGALRLAGQIEYERIATRAHEDGGGGAGAAVGAGAEAPPARPGFRPRVGLGWILGPELVVRNLSGPSFGVLDPFGAANLDIARKAMDETVKSLAPMLRCLRDMYFIHSGKWRVIEKWNDAHTERHAAPDSMDFSLVSKYLQWNAVWLVELVDRTIGGPGGRVSADEAEEDPTAIGPAVSVGTLKVLSRFTEEARHYMGHQSHLVEGSEIEVDGHKCGSLRNARTVERLLSDAQKIFDQFRVLVRDPKHTADSLCQKLGPAKCRYGPRCYRRATCAYYHGSGAGEDERYYGRILDKADMPLRVGGYARAPPGYPSLGLARNVRATQLKDNATAVSTGLINLWRERRRDAMDLATLAGNAMRGFMRQFREMGVRNSRIYALAQSVSFAGDPSAVVAIARRELSELRMDVGFDAPGTPLRPDSMAEYLMLQRSMSRSLISLLPTCESQTRPDDHRDRDLMMAYLATQVPHPEALPEGDPVKYVLVGMPRDPADATERTPMSEDDASKLADAVERYLPVDDEVSSARVSRFLVRDVTVRRRDGRGRGAAWLQSLRDEIGLPAASVAGPPPPPAPPAGPL